MASPNGLPLPVTNCACTVETIEVPVEGASHVTRQLLPSETIAPRLVAPMSARIRKGGPRLVPSPERNCPYRSEGGSSVSAQTIRWFVPLGANKGALPL